MVKKLGILLVCIMMVNSLLFVFPLENVKADLTTGLVGYWNFDEGSGTIAHDSSGYGNDGIINGANWTVGIYNNALIFDGLNDFVSIEDDISLRTNVFTISLWVNFNLPKKTCILISKTFGAFTFESYAIWYRDIFLNANIGNATGIDPYLQYIWAPSFETWYYLTYVFDDSLNVETLYINGEVVKTETNNKTISFDSHPILLGAEYEFDILDYFFSGKIDEVRIYNKALSKSEILNLYYNPNGNQSVIEIEKITGSFGISAKIINTGSGIGKNISCSINVSGFIIISGNYTQDFIGVLEAGASVTIKSKNLIGIGPITITIQVADISKKATAFLLGPLVLRVNEI